MTNFSLARQALLPAVGVDLTRIGRRLTSKLPSFCLILDEITDRIIGSWTDRGTSFPWNVQGTIFPWNIRGTSPLAHSRMSRQREVSFRAVIGDHEADAPALQVCRKPRIPNLQGSDRFLTSKMNRSSFGVAQVQHLEE
ncbi:hypothetical protein BDN67DRAFT_596029 [Paxillus ammoniavirescens]|nr:hypothetical protein BDN67DRAFT_596029 [Paxillus ammoniavirescens]